MAKMLRCQEIGMDCDFVAQAETEAELMRQVAEHARSRHGIKRLAPELAAKVRTAIRDEEAKVPPPTA